VARPLWTEAVNRPRAPLPAAERQSRHARAGSKGNCHVGTVRECHHHESRKRRQAANSERLIFPRRCWSSRRLSSRLSHVRQKMRARVARASIIGRDTQLTPANNVQPASSLLKSFASSLDAGRVAGRPIARDVLWDDGYRLALQSKVRVFPEKSQAILVHGGSLSIHMNLITL
jgi:hypothetical protein